MATLNYYFPGNMFKDFYRKLQTPPPNLGYSFNLCISERFQG